MPNAVETLGTGETFTTNQSWEDALDNAHPHRGECKAEVFSGVTFSGITYSEANGPTLTSVDGAQHDGRAHEVSGIGNARIEFVGTLHIVWPGNPFVTVSWIEVKGPGNNSFDSVSMIGTGSDFVMLHHCILHNNDAVSSGGVLNYGFQHRTGSAGDGRVFRNIVYGVGTAGLRLRSGSGATLHNTVYDNNHSDVAGGAGIRSSTANYDIKANACFDNSQKDIDGTTGTLSNNATSDATSTEGTNNLINQVATDTFVAATTNFALTDLLLKAGSNLIDAGETTFSTATYPEIDVSIDNRGVSITGTWDIGAHQFVGVPAGIEVDATTDALTLTEHGAGVNAGISFTAGLDALTLTEHNPIINAEINIGTTLEQLTLTEHDASVNARIGINATSEALTLVEHNADVRVDININASSESLALIEHNANINAEVDILATLESLTLAEFNAVINAEINVSATSETLTLVEYNADVKADINIEATKESLILAEHNADINIVINISTTSQALTLAEFKASVNAEINVDAALTQLSLVEYNANILTDSDSIFRTLNIVAESRVLNIIDESRILAIIAENREIDIIPENRELTL